MKVFPQSYSLFNFSEFSRFKICDITNATQNDQVSECSMSKQYDCFRASLEIRESISSDVLMVLAKKLKSSYVKKMPLQVQHVNKIDG